jgi:hypothetical protein
MKKFVFFAVVVCICGLVQASGVWYQPSSIQQQQGSGVSGYLMGVNNGAGSTSIMIGQGQQDGNWRQSASQNSQTIMDAQVMTGHNGIGVVTSGAGNTQGQYVGNGVILQNQGGGVSLGTTASGNATAVGCIAQASDQYASGQGMFAASGQIVAVFSISSASSPWCSSGGVAANCVEVQQCQQSVVN